MKKAIAILFLFSINFLAVQAQQKKLLTIHCSFPQKINSGNKINLKVMITHQLEKEQTGNITFEITDNNNKSVDGWFLNIFPFQYFTSTAKENFETTFPFTVPSNFSGTLKLILKASCGEAKDSVIHIAQVNTKNIIHE
jgi:hypothetical protein